jgi:hypothetical protein
MPINGFKQIAGGADIVEILEAQVPLLFFPPFNLNLSAMARWNWSLALLFLLTSQICCDQQEQVEGFFSQSGHTNNWAVLASIYAF